MTDDRQPPTQRAPGDAEPAESRGQGEDAQQDRDDDAPDAARDLTANLEDQLRRALADLDNVRKRFQRDLDRERAAERARFAAAWLPVVDNLELALRHADDEARAFIDGVRAVHEQAVSTLARLGYPRLDPVGQTFDPILHEAVTTVAAEGEPGTVVDVVRAGYGTPEALLRPAGVVVARK
ncbi:MAG: grpE [Nocardioides sp.]|nr:grpE [Nocardioides sp.]